MEAASARRIRRELTAAPQSPRDFTSKKKLREGAKISKDWQDLSPVHTLTICVTWLSGEEPTMPESFPARRDKLLAQIKTEGIDGFLVSHPVNVSYLTGFSGDSSYLFLTPRQTLLLSDGRFTTQIQEECPGLAAHIRPPSQPILQAAAEMATSLGIRSLGYEKNHLTVAALETLREATPALNWLGLGDAVEQLRMVKDEDELGQIREAIWLAERAYAMFRASLRGGDSEKDLADAMEMHIRRAGGKCSSFPTIVALGERSALPHAVPTARMVRESNLLLLDWGAAGTFYKSDLTRVLIPRRKTPTHPLPAAPVSEVKLRDIYEVVLRAREQALRFLRPGVKSGEVDAAARQVIVDAGYGDQFTHSLGHGLGREVHEGPMLRPGTETVMKAGMVVTIEPGIYIQGWGGVRIEDDVVVTPDGCQVLTGVPRDFDSQYVDY
jgi:Xaa-Pro aminopeptidase